MMEVVFSSSAAGSLKTAQACAPQIGSGAEDLFCFDLQLSAGTLSGDCLSDSRADDLQQLYAMFPEERERYRRKQTEAKESLSRLTARASAGEPARIWYSENPDEYCGLCWLVHTLGSRMTHQPPLRLMRLPNQREKQNVIYEYQGWGEVSPEEFAAFLSREAAPGTAFLRKLTGEWLEAQAENMPLRAFVNGRLHGVSADFYDGFIRREISKAEPVFCQAELIGSVMGRYQLKISDLWIAARMEAMMEQGELCPVTEASSDEARYRRMLQRVRC